MFTLQDLGECIYIGINSVIYPGNLSVNNFKRVENKSPICSPTKISYISKQENGKMK